ncbi:hypothetical protein VPHD51_0222 [Vibrio phage D51]
MLFKFNIPYRIRYRIIGIAYCLFMIYCTVKVSEL